MSKVKELTAEQTKESAAALPHEKPPVIYLTERCKVCGISPVVRQGGGKGIVTCGTCSKVIEVAA